MEEISTAVESISASTEEVSTTVEGISVSTEKVSTAIEGISVSTEKVSTANSAKNNRQKKPAIHLGRPVYTL